MKKQILIGIVMILMISTMVNAAAPVPSGPTEGTEVTVTNAVSVTESLTVNRGSHIEVSNPPFSLTKVGEIKSGGIVSYVDSSGDSIEVNGDTGLVLRVQDKNGNQIDSVTVQVAEDENVPITELKAEVIDVPLGQQQTSLLLEPEREVGWRTEKTHRGDAISKAIENYMKLIQPSAGAYIIEDLILGKKDIASYDLNPDRWGKLSFLLDGYNALIIQAFCNAKAYSKYFSPNDPAQFIVGGALPIKSDILFVTGKRTECEIPAAGACDSQNRFINQSGGPSTYLYKITWRVTNQNSKNAQKQGVVDGKISFRIHMKGSNTEITSPKIVLDPGAESSAVLVGNNEINLNKICIQFEDGYVYDGTHGEWPAGAGCTGDIVKQKTTGQLPPAIDNSQTGGTESDPGSGWFLGR